MHLIFLAWQGTVVLVLKTLPYITLYVEGLGASRINFKPTLTCWNINFCQILYTFAVIKIKHAHFRFIAGKFYSGM